MTMVIPISASRKTRQSSVLATRLSRGVLRVPLVVKIIGANIGIVVVAVAMQAMLFRGEHRSEILIVLAGLAVASLVSWILVRIALSPVKELETLAHRVQSGDFQARAEQSPFADADLARLGKTVNDLLDSLAAERLRIHHLGAEVIYAQDEERARVSRELHDSIAQTLAAVRFQLAAVANSAEGDVRNRIVAAMSLAGTAMEEVKNVSYSLHPRVAEDLGIQAALETLARQVESRSKVRVSVTADIGSSPIPSRLSATLFRVAQEALRNIEVHSHAKLATVTVVSREGVIRLEVSDDGCGFDPAVTSSPAAHSALASVKDRVTLAGGVMNIDSNPNGGTRVTVRLQTMREVS